MEPTTRTEAPHWRARPALAVALRAAITLVPIIIVTLTAWQIHLALGPPTVLIDGVARWVALSAGCTIAIRLLDRVAKKLLPLTVLLRMTVVFPDDVPSRFRVAMRYGTTRQLERDVHAGELSAYTPQDAAERLLGLVTQLSVHDRATRGHTERVRAYADLVGEQMGFNTEERQKLHWAGLIHDIGKLSVPASILNKTDPLTEREWLQLRLHPNEGWALVQPLRPWLGEWAEATRDHHERWDGNGYPQGLRGPEISRAGRIIAVVDAFDVMTSTRSYKEAISFDEARSELASCSENHFDPDVVRSFLGLSLTKRRNRWAVLSWIANSPIVSSVSSGAAVPSSMVVGMAAATIAAGSMVIPSTNSEPLPEMAIERVVEATTTTSTVAPATTVPATTSPPTTVAPTTSETPTTTIAPAVTTTTPAPAPTTTIAPVTTTLEPSSLLSNGFLGGGAGSILNLVSSISQGQTLNVDGDANPGLTIPRSTSGLIEINSPNVKAWSVPISIDTLLVGNASLRIHAAIDGFQDGFAVLLVGLVECTGPSSGCTEITSGQAGFAQVGFGSDFGEVEVYLGSINYTITEGNYILVTVAVAQDSTHDVWVEFGTPTYPSELRIT